MASRTSRNDSSGSDEEYGYQVSGKREMHYHADCRYTKFKLVFGRLEVYVWLRSCLCDRYHSFDIKKGVKHLDPEEGKDVHYNAECRWRKVKKDEGWEWSKKCLNCRPPPTASYTGNASYPGFNQYKY